MENLEMDYGIRVKQWYKNGECPDCGEEIPIMATGGDECKNCGHIFWPEHQLTKPISFDNIYLWTFC